MWVNLPQISHLESGSIRVQAQGHLAPRLALAETLTAEARDLSLARPLHHSAHPYQKDDRQG